MENGTEVTFKIKNKTPVRSSISTSGYLSTENKYINSKGYAPHVLCGITYNSQDMETIHVHQYMNT